MQNLPANNQSSRTIYENPLHMYLQMYQSQSPCLVSDSVSVETGHLSYQHFSTLDMQIKVRIETQAFAYINHLHEDIGKIPKLKYCSPMQNYKFLQFVVACAFACTGTKQADKG